MDAVSVMVKFKAERNQEKSHYLGRVNTTTQPTNERDSLTKDREESVQQGSPIPITPAVGIGDARTYPGHGNTAFAATPTGHCGTADAEELASASGPRSGCRHKRCFFRASGSGEGAGLGRGEAEDMERLGLAGPELEGVFGE